MKWSVIGVVLFIVLSSASLYVYATNPARQFRVEVFGEVASGSIYTTGLNLQEFDPLLPATQPFLASFSVTGGLLSYRETESSPLAYVQYSDGVSSYALLDKESKLWSSRILIETTGRTHYLAVKDNPHTDIHGILRTGPDSFILPSNKSYTLADGTKIESFFLEEQFLDGRIGFTWDSLDHVPVENSYTKELRTYWLENNINDYFHGNSVRFANDGNLLISGRHINQIIKISTTTGEVIWRLGGEDSDFVFQNDPLGGFNHQHSATQLTNGHILLYDNGNLHNPPQTRVVEYALDETTMTATLVWGYATPGRFTYAAGSVQRLPNGHTLIGWGMEFKMDNKTPRITEVDESGKVVLQIYFPNDVGFYSAYKFE